MQEFVFNSGVTLTIAIGLSFAFYSLFHLDEDSILSNAVTVALLAVTLLMGYFVCSRPYP